MNEKFKAKLSRLKIHAKKHGPAILGGIGTVVAGAFAIHYRNLVAEMEAIDKQTDGWSTIKIHPKQRKDIENGATLKYREIRIDSDHIYTQATTLDDFSDDMNERFHSKRPVDDVVGDVPEDPSTDK